MQLLPKRYGLDLKLDVVTLSLSSGGASGAPGTALDAHEDQGTADAIRAVRNKLTSPRILLVSCDLISEVQLQQLSDVHRVRGAALTALFAEGQQGVIPVPGPKSKQKKGLACFLLF